MSLIATSSEAWIDVLARQGVRLPLLCASVERAPDSPDRDVLLDALAAMEPLVKDAMGLQRMRLALERLSELPFATLALDFFVSAYPWLGVTLTEAAGQPISLDMRVHWNTPPALPEHTGKSFDAVHASPLGVLIDHADAWAVWEEPLAARTSRKPMGGQGDRAATRSVTLAWRVARGRFLGRHDAQSTSRRRRAAATTQVGVGESVSTGTEPLPVPDIDPQAGKFFSRLFALAETTADRFRNATIAFPGDPTARTGWRDFCARLVARELQLQKQTAEFDEVNRKKNQLLSVAAHDLRHPVGMVREYAAIIKDELAANPDVLRQLDAAAENTPAERAGSGLWPAVETLSTMILSMLDRIVDLSDYSLHMVNDVLDFTQIQAGEFDLHLLPVSLREFAKDVRDMHYFVAQAKGVQLRVKVSDTGNGEFLTDNQKLMQLANNLLSNAIKYSPSGKPTVFKIEADEQTVRLIFKDEGVGIASEEIDRLFIPFRRGSASPTGGEHSTGLGLAIVKKITDVLGGMIEVYSTPGLGSTFVVALPRNLNEVRARVRPYSGDTMVKPRNVMHADLKDAVERAMADGEGDGDGDGNSDLSTELGNPPTFHHRPHFDTPPSVARAPTDPGTSSADDSIAG